MILGRISKAIREQNWFAVVLEFVIVIAGVVIGFQVSQWSNDRAEAERRAVVLDRLHDEIEASIGRLEVQVAYYEWINVDRTELIERILASDGSNFDDEGLSTATVTNRLYPAFEPPRGVYDEAISSGMLSTLGDRAFRDSLSNYQAEVRFLQGQITYFRNSALSRPSIQDFDFYSTVYDPDSSRQRNHVMDWQAAVNDPDFLPYLLDTNNSMRAIAGWWRDTLDAALAVCAETARLTGRPCAPEEAAP